LAIPGPMMFQPGTILLEKYRVERVLGKGGMGVVVAVRHVQLGELFALKVLLPESRDQPEALERFLLEARAAAKLKSEHVARVHDVGKLPDGTPYMLMEHLEGEDLSDLLASRQRLSVGEAALYVHQACQAVAKAHANGIVHRDLKPSNLFLTRNSNGSPCVKVLDFGIVKELDPQNRVGKNLTKTGTFLGSPLYMPPEQMADIKLTDTRGDVWALGVILYEFLTGEAPFAAEAVTSVITKVLLTHPPPPSRVVAGVPPEFDAIVMRCLEKQPDLRYPTAHELMVELEPFVKGGAIHDDIEANTNGPSSISANVSRLQLAETMAGPLGLPLTPTDEAIAETIAGDTAIPKVASAASLMVSPPMQSVDANEILARAMGLGGRPAAKPLGDRKKILWGMVIFASFVITAVVVFVSTNAPPAESSNDQPTSTSQALAAPSASLPDIVKTTPQVSLAPTELSANAPVVTGQMNAVDKAGAAPSTTSTVPSKPQPSVVKTTRPSTKKTRVPGYDD
jgi:serine/threonine protein kinase